MAEGADKGGGWVRGGQARTDLKLLDADIN